MADASWTNLRVIALDTRWRCVWQQQLAAAGFLATAAVAQLFTSRRRWRRLAAPASAIVCFALPRTGHAAVESFGWLLHGVHLAGAGAWAGSLAVVVFSAGPSDRPRLLRAFAPVAFASVVVLASTGAVAAAVYLGDFADLWDSHYGRLPCCSSCCSWP
jgi:putative copper export protein